MKRHYLLSGFILISVFCLSVYFFFDKNTAQKLDEKKVITASTTISSSKSIAKPLATYSKKISTPATFKNQPASSVINNIQLLENKNLIAAAKAFWARCTRHKNCEVQLKILHNQLDEKSYKIIQEYPQKISEFNNTLQYELTSPSQSLEQKLSVIKTTYNTLWGDLAKQLFVDELEYYEQRLALDKLEHTSQYLNIDEKTQLFNEWINAKKSNNHLTHYKAAQLFFSKEIEANPKFAIAIAKKYLTTEQATQEKTRLQRQLHQKVQAKNYQESFLELNIQLKAEREGSHSNLNKADWLEYKTQRVYEFRREFFK